MQAVKRLNKFYNREDEKDRRLGTGSVAFWTTLLLRETRRTPISR